MSFSNSQRRMEFTIEPLLRHAEFEDVVVRWLHSEWGGDASEFARLLQPSDDRPGAIVAISVNRPIGVLAFKRCRALFQSAPELWVNAVYVDPNHRRKGIGRELVRTSSDVCHANDVARLYASTDVPGLYFACGWERLKFTADTGISTMTRQILTDIYEDE